MTEENNHKNAESKTQDVQVLHGGRARVTLRLKPEIKETIISFCKKNDVTLCHIIEALLTGYLEGMKQKINWDVQSPTINLTLVREVKRIRRYAREAEPETNFYDPNLTSWIYVSDATLNEYGHVVGCGCKVCRRLCQIGNRLLG